MYFHCRAKFHFKRLIEVTQGHSILLLMMMTFALSRSQPSPSHCHRHHNLFRDEKASQDSQNVSGGSLKRTKSLHGPRGEEIQFTCKEKAAVVKLGRKWNQRRALDSHVKNQQRRKLTQNDIFGSERLYRTGIMRQCLREDRQRTRINDLIQYFRRTSTDRCNEFCLIRGLQRQSARWDLTTQCYHTMEGVSRGVFQPFLPSSWWAPPPVVSTPPECFHNKVSSQNILSAFNQYIQHQYILRIILASGDLNVYRHSTLKSIGGPPRERSCTIL